MTISIQDIINTFVSATEKVGGIVYCVTTQYDKIAISLTKYTKP